MCFEYKVHFQRSSDEDHGSTDVSTKEIWINTRFNEDIQRETLFHELLHVVFDDCALLESGAVKTTDPEESLIRYISPRLVLLFQENPWLSEYIINKVLLEDTGKKRK